MIADIQNASIWKRISALLLDLVVIAILATGFAFLMSVITNYGYYDEKLEGYYAEYEETYGFKVSITKAEYEELSPEDQQRCQEMFDDLNSNQDVLYVYNMTINLSLVIITTSILLAVLISEFVMPLIFKNGQTIGKKIFAIGVVNTNSVKIKPVQLFARAILGKYAIEIMLPIIVLLLIIFGRIGWIGSVILIGLAAFQVIIVAVTKYHQAIHDALSYTVVVDMQTQMIFDSDEERLEYIKNNHQMEVSKEK